MFPQWEYGAKRIKPKIVGKPIVFGKMTFLYTWLGHGIIHRDEI